MIEDDLSDFNVCICYNEETQTENLSNSCYLANNSGSCYDSTCKIKTSISEGDVILTSDGELSQSELVSNHIKGICCYCRQELKPIILCDACREIKIKQTQPLYYPHNFDDKKLRYHEGKEEKQIASEGDNFYYDANYYEPKQTPLIGGHSYNCPLKDKTIYYEPKQQKLCQPDIEWATSKEEELSDSKIIFPSVLQPLECAYFGNDNVKPKKIESAGSSYEENRPAVKRNFYNSSNNNNNNIASVDNESSTPNTQSKQSFGSETDDDCVDKANKSYVQTISNCDNKLQIKKSSSSASDGEIFVFNEHRITTNKIETKGKPVRQFTYDNKHIGTLNQKPKTKTKCNCQKVKGKTLTEYNFEKFSMKSSDNSSRNSSISRQEQLVVCYGEEFKDIDDEMYAETSALIKNKCSSKLKQQSIRNEFKDEDFSKLRIKRSRSTDECESEGSTKKISQPQSLSYVDVDDFQKMKKSNKYKTRSKQRSFTDNEGTEEILDIKKKGSKRSNKTIDDTSEMERKSSGRSQQQSTIDDLFSNMKKNISCTSKPDLIYSDDDTSEMKRKSSGRSKQQSMIDRGNSEMKKKNSSRSKEQSIFDDDDDDKESLEKKNICRGKCSNRPNPHSSIYSGISDIKRKSSSKSKPQSIIDDDDVSEVKKKSSARSKQSSILGNDDISELKIKSNYTAKHPSVINSVISKMKKKVSYTSKQQSMFIDDATSEMKRKSSGRSNQQSAIDDDILEGKEKSSVRSKQSSIVEDLEKKSNYTPKQQSLIEDAIIKMKKGTSYTSKQQSLFTNEDTSEMKRSSGRSKQQSMIDNDNIMMKKRTSYTSKQQSLFTNEDTSEMKRSSGRSKQQSMIDNDNSELKKQSSTRSKQLSILGDKNISELEQKSNYSGRSKQSKIDDNILEVKEKHGSRSKQRLMINAGISDMKSKSSNRSKQQSILDDDDISMNKKPIDPCSCRSNVGLMIDDDSSEIESTSSTRLEQRSRSGDVDVLKMKKNSSTRSKQHDRISEVRKRSNSRSKQQSIFGEDISLNKESSRSNKQPIFGDDDNSEVKNKYREIYSGRSNQKSRLGDDMDGKSGYTSKLKSRYDPNRKASDYDSIESNEVNNNKIQGKSVHNRDINECPVARDNKKDRTKRKFSNHDNDLQIENKYPDSYYYYTEKESKSKINPEFDNGDKKRKNNPKIIDCDITDFPTVKHKNRDLLQRESTNCDSDYDSASSDKKEISSSKIKAESLNYCETDCPAVKVESDLSEEESADEGEKKRKNNRKINDCGINDCPAVKDESDLSEKESAEKTDKKRKNNLKINYCDLNDCPTVKDKKRDRLQREPTEGDSDCDSASGDIKEKSSNKIRLKGEFFNYCRIYDCPAVKDISDLSEQELDDNIDRKRKIKRKINHCISNDCPMVTNKKGDRLQRESTECNYDYNLASVDKKKKTSSKLRVKGESYYCGIDDCPAVKNRGEQESADNCDKKRKNSCKINDCDMNDCPAVKDKKEKSSSKIRVKAESFNYCGIDDCPAVKDRGQQESADNSDKNRKNTCKINDCVINDCPAVKDKKEKNSSKIRVKAESINYCGIIDCPAVKERREQELADNGDKKRKNSCKLNDCDINDCPAVKDKKEKDSSKIGVKGESFNYCEINECPAVKDKCEQESAVDSDRNRKSSCKINDCDINDCAAVKDKKRYRIQRESIECDFDCDSANDDQKEKNSSRIKVKGESFNYCRTNDCPAVKDKGDPSEQESTDNVDRKRKNKRKINDCRNSDCPAVRNKKYDRLRRESTDCDSVGYSASVGKKEENSSKIKGVNGESYGDLKDCPALKDEDDLSEQESTDDGDKDRKHTRKEKNSTRIKGVKGDSCCELKDCPVVKDEGDLPEQETADNSGKKRKHNRNINDCDINDCPTVKDKKRDRLQGKLTKHDSDSDSVDEKDTNGNKIKGESLNYLEIDDSQAVKNKSDLSEHESASWDSDSESNSADRQDSTKNKIKRKPLNDNYINEYPGVKNKNSNMLNWDSHNFKPNGTEEIKNRKIQNRPLNYCDIYNCKTVKENNNDSNWIDKNEKSDRKIKGKPLNNDIKDNPKAADNKNDMSLRNSNIYNPNYTEPTTKHKKNRSKSESTDCDADCDSDCADRKKIQNYEINDDKNYKYFTSKDEKRDWSKRELTDPDCIHRDEKNNRIINEEKLYDADIIASSAVKETKGYRSKRQTNEYDSACIDKKQKNRRKIKGRPLYASDFYDSQLVRFKKCYRPKRKANERNGVDRNQTHSCRKKRKVKDKEDDHVKQKPTDCDPDCDRRNKMNNRKMNGESFNNCDINNCPTVKNQRDDPPRRKSTDRSLDQVHRNEVNNRKINGESLYDCDIYQCPAVQDKRSDRSKRIPTNLDSDFVDRKNRNIKRKPFYDYEINDCLAVKDKKSDRPKRKATDHNPDCVHRKKKCSTYGHLNNYPEVKYNKQERELSYCAIHCDNYDYSAIYDHDEHCKIENYAVNNRKDNQYKCQSPDWDIQECPAIRAFFKSNTTNYNEVSGISLHDCGNIDCPLKKYKQNHVSKQESNGRDPTNVERKKKNIVELLDGCEMNDYSTMKRNTCYRQKSESMNLNHNCVDGNKANVGELLNYCDTTDCPTVIDNEYDSPQPESTECKPQVCAEREKINNCNLKGKSLYDCDINDHLTVKYKKYDQSIGEITHYDPNYTDRNKTYPTAKHRKSDRPKRISTDWDIQECPAVKVCLENNGTNNHKVKKESMYINDCPAVKCKKCNQPKQESSDSNLDCVNREMPHIRESLNGFKFIDCPAEKGKKGDPQKGKSTDCDICDCSTVKEYVDTEKTNSSKIKGDSLYECHINGDRNKTNVEESIRYHGVKDFAYRKMKGGDLYDCDVNYCPAVKHKKCDQPKRESTDCDPECNHGSLHGFDFIDCPAKKGKNGDRQKRDIYDHSTVKECVDREKINTNKVKGDSIYDCNINDDKNKTNVEESLSYCDVTDCPEVENKREDPEKQKSRDCNIYECEIKNCPEVKQKNCDQQKQKSPDCDPDYADRKEPNIQESLDDCDNISCLPTKIDKGEQRKGESTDCDPDHIDRNKENIQESLHYCDITDCPAVEEKKDDRPKRESPTCNIYDYRTMKDFAAVKHKKCDQQKQELHDSDSECVERKEPNIQESLGDCNIIDFLTAKDKKGDRRERALTDCDPGCLNKNQVKMGESLYCYDIVGAVKHNKSDRSCRKSTDWDIQECPALKICLESNKANKRELNGKSLCDYDNNDYPLVKYKQNNILKQDSSVCINRKEPNVRESLDDFDIIDYSAVKPKNCDQPTESSDSNPDYVNRKKSDIQDSLDNFDIIDCPSEASKGKGDQQERESTDSFDSEKAKSLKINGESLYDYDINGCPVAKHKKFYQPKPEPTGCDPDCGGRKKSNTQELFDDGDIIDRPAVKGNKNDRLQSESTDGDPGYVDQNKTDIGESLYYCAILECPTVRKSNRSQQELSDWNIQECPALKACLESNEPNNVKMEETSLNNFCINDCPVLYIQCDKRKLKSSNCNTDCISRKEPKIPESLDDFDIIDCPVRKRKKRHQPKRESSDCSPDSVKKNEPNTRKSLVDFDITDSPAEKGKKDNLNETNVGESLPYCDINGCPAVKDKKSDRTKRDSTDCDIYNCPSVKECVDSEKTKSRKIKPESLCDIQDCPVVKYKKCDQPNREPADCDLDCVARNDCDIYNCPSVKDCGDSEKTNSRKTKEDSSCDINDCPAVKLKKGDQPKRESSCNSHCVAKSDCEIYECASMKFNSRNSSKKDIISTSNEEIPQIKKNTSEIKKQKPSQQSTTNEINRLEKKPKTDIKSKQSSNINDGNRSKTSSKSIIKSKQSKIEDGSSEKKKISVKAKPLITDADMSEKTGKSSGRSKQQSMIHDDNSTEKTGTSSERSKQQSTTDDTSKIKNECTCRSKDLSMGENIPDLKRRSSCRDRKVVYAERLELIEPKIVCLTREKDAGRMQRIRGFFKKKGEPNYEDKRQKRSTTDKEDTFHHDCCKCGNNDYLPEYYECKYKNKNVENLPDNCCCETTDKKVDHLIDNCYFETKNKNVKNGPDNCECETIDKKVDLLADNCDCEITNEKYLPTNCCFDTKDNNVDYQPENCDCTTVDKKVDHRTDTFHCATIDKNVDYLTDNCYCETTDENSNYLPDNCYCETTKEKVDSLPDNCYCETTKEKVDSLLDNCYCETANKKIGYPLENCYRESKYEKSNYQLDNCCCKTNDSKDCSQQKKPKSNKKDTRTEKYKVNKDPKKCASNSRKIIICPRSNHSSYIECMNLSKCNKKKSSFGNSTSAIRHGSDVINKNDLRSRSKCRSKELSN